MGAGSILILNTLIAKPPLLNYQLSKGGLVVDLANAMTFRLFMYRAKPDFGSQANFVELYCHGYVFYTNVDSIQGF